MQATAALLLCPPSMTAPAGGPTGIVGDRLHQLPAVIAATRRFERVYVWPADAVVRQVFQFIPVEFIAADDPVEAIRVARQPGIESVFGLYADPTVGQVADPYSCAPVLAAHDLALHAAGAGAALSLPPELDPLGAVPLWRQLVELVAPASAWAGVWPAMPFSVPGPAYGEWAQRFVTRRAGIARTILASPLSGGPKGVIDDPPAWWSRLARRFARGHIFVPVQHAEIARTEALFGGAANVTVFAADLAKTAALAALDRMRVVGVDGGRFNIMAAARADGAEGFYGVWPASAWALPSVVLRTPEEVMETIASEGC